MTKEVAKETTPAANGRQSRAKSASEESLKRMEDFPRRKEDFMAAGRPLLGAQSAGLLMTPEEFDGIDDYDGNFRYELVQGVVVVAPIPLPEETDPNDLLGHYLQAGIQEYWIFDLFQRTLTVIHNKPTGAEEQVIVENETYESPLLPSFQVPLARLLAAADQWIQEE